MNNPDPGKSLAKNTPSRRQPPVAHCDLPQEVLAHDLGPALKRCYLCATREGRG